MKLVESTLPGVLVIEPAVFGDSGGWFYESYNERALEEMGLRARFVQDNHSRSARNVLRGPHYQIRRPQGKLVRVTAGEIFDVVVDIRRSCPTFGKWTSIILSESNRRLGWVPPGYAQSFLVTGSHADLIP